MFWIWRVLTCYVWDHDVFMLDNLIVYFFFLIAKLLAFGESLAFTGDLVSWGIANGNFKDTVKSKSVSFLGARGMWWLGIWALWVLLLVNTCFFFRSELETFWRVKVTFRFLGKKKEFKDILHFKTYFVVRSHSLVNLECLPYWFLMLTTWLWFHQRILSRPTEGH